MGEDSFAPQHIKVSVQFHPGAPRGARAVLLDSLGEYPGEVGAVAALLEADEPGLERAA